MSLTTFIGPSVEAAAGCVVTAIRTGNWESLSALLASNAQSLRQVKRWQRPEGPPDIKDGPEIQLIPELMTHYPGKFLVRYEIPDEPSVYKLEVVVEAFGAQFRVIDFWGLGW